MGAGCGVWVENADLNGDDVDWQWGPSTQEACWNLCEANSACNAVTYQVSTGHCYMKSIAEAKVASHSTIFDSKRRCEPGKFVPTATSCAVDITTGWLLLLLNLGGEYLNSFRSSTV